MKFTRTTDQQDMAKALRELLSSIDLNSIGRSWSEGDTKPWAETWQQLAGMGVAGLMISARDDGLELGTVELITCLEELGYAGLPGPHVESVAVLPRLLHGTSTGRQWLPRLASGQAIGTVTFTDHVPYALDADMADVVLACEGSTTGVVENPSLLRQDSFDPTRRLFTVDSAVKPIDADTKSVRTAFDLGVLACAAQLLGIGHRLLDMSTRYVQERHQFGRPIGQFQAVKHHLANVLLKLQFARPLLNGACLSLSADQAHGARDVSAAKVALSDAAHLAARTALQVHGAIGYTVEHELHWWLAKATALRSAWGSPGWHRARVAEALATGSANAIGE